MLDALWVTKSVGITIVTPPHVHGEPEGCKLSRCMERKVHVWFTASGTVQRVNGWLGIDNGDDLEPLLILERRGS